MCGGGTSTSTNLSTADPRVSANYDYITGRAKGVADIPYQYYPGNLVAGVPGQMQSGFDIINQTQGVASPFISQAAQYAQQGAAPIDASSIQRYMNPYQQNVIDATMANIDEMNGRQQQDVIGNAISKGAWGGDRAGVAQAELARQQGLAAGQTLAGLQSQGYGQALSAAQQDAQRQSQAAYTMGALGQEAQSTALTGANAQIGAGQLQQQQAQNQINADYSQFQQARQYPFNTEQWLAAILGGQAGQLGGTSSTTSPAPGIAQQAIGAGAGIAGILGATGAFGSSGWLWSDERLKENIQPIGRAFDGQMIYRYNFKGDPATQIGFLAQEVERHAPGAVHEIDGIKGVDYHDATDEAADRGGFATGGITAMNAPMIPSIDSYTPETNPPAFGPLVAQGYELKSITKPAYEQATRGGFDGGGAVPYGDGTPFPQLGTVNGMPVPLAANPVQSFSAPPLTAGRSRMPTAPKAGGQSDIGTDVVRMAQMLRSYGFGKRPGGGGQPQSYGSVGDLVSAQGLKSGGRAPRADGGGSGGADDLDNDGLSWVTVPMPTRAAQMVTVPMPRAAMAPPTPIDLPYAPDYSRAERSEPPRDFVPITTALASLRDEMQGAPSPSGVAAGPAPDVAPVTVAAAPTGVAGRTFPSDYAARISRVEGARPDATNPDTGAAGYYQFMPDTAYGLAQRTAWGRGLSKPQVMAAIKADPAKQDELLSLYNGFSTGALKQAGLPATDANMYALHAFGPAGGVSLLRADPNMPMADWVRSVRWDNGATPEQVIAQNGLGKYRTVGDLRRGFIEARIGGPSPSGVAVAGARPTGAGVAPDDGGDGEGSGVEGDSAPPAGASGVAAPAPDDSGEGAAPPKDGAPRDGSGGDWSDRFMQSPWLALAQLGFGMASSRNPTLLGALGEGGLQGVQTAMAQGKMKRELAQAKAMEAYRNAHLAISGRQADRQMQLAEETMRRNAAAEAARQRSLDIQDRRAASAQAHQQQTEDFKRTAIERFVPDPAKATDYYTGLPVYRNQLGEERLRLPDGRLMTREDANKESGVSDSRVDRTFQTPSGQTLTIPAADPREATTLTADDRKQLAKQGADIAKQASTASALARLLKEVQAAYNELPKSGTGAPGAMAETWRRVASASQGITDTLGIAPLVDPKTTGNLQELNKLTTQLATLATKNLSARPAVFEFQRNLETQPGLQLTPDAFKKVAGYMLADAQRAVDLGAYARQYQLHHRSLNGVEEAFNQQQPDGGTRLDTGRGAPGASADPGYKAGQIIPGKDGKIYKFKGGDWRDRSNYDPVP